MNTTKPIRLLTAVIAMACGASAQTSFPTGTNVAIAKPGMNNAAKVYTIYTSTNAASATFVPGVTISATHDLNGIGLNPADNMIYAASYTGNTNNISTAFDVSLKRVGMDGTVVDLGMLPLSGGGGSGATEFVNFSAGTVSANGSYYYMTYAIKSASVTRILLRVAFGMQPDLTANDLRMFLCWKDNVSSLPPNPGAPIAGGVSGSYELNFSNTDVTAAINAFLGQVNSSYPDVFNADGGIQDFAINPVDTKVYGYISYPSGASTVGRPVVMNVPVAGVSAIMPVGASINATPGQEVAGVQFDGTGNFYGLFTTGDYAQIDLTTGALSGMTMSNVITSGGNLRGDLAPAITNVPFPVDIISFEGSRTGAVNNLTWQTATERNNKAFTMERSADGRSWSAIGTIYSKAANGNSAEKISYSFADNNPLQSLTHYRLSQTDLDGQVVVYSRYITLEAPSGSMQLYPNPATDQLHITGANAAAGIKIVDIAGRTIDAGHLSTMAGNELLIDTRTLSPGTYFLQVTNSEHTVHFFKFIKK